jgi:hypothetical protein
MLARVMRWFLIGAPALAGILLLILGTAGSISVAFGVTLIGISALIWMSNWFIRMTFSDHRPEKDTQAREQRADEQRRKRERAKAPAPPRHPQRPSGAQPRRPRRPL